MRRRGRYWAIVAGGTGGHIIPSLVFGSWLEENHGSVATRYFTGSRDLEKKIFEFHGKKPQFLKLSGSPRGVRGFYAFLRCLSMGYVALRLIFSFLRNPPKALFLFGGYLSVPFIVTAKLLLIPTVIHEQNALAGKATRLGSFLGIPVCAGWKECLGVKKENFIFSGIPVRKLQHLHVLDAWNKLGSGVPFPSGKIILVLGGSLGSKLLIELALSLSGCEEYGDCHFLILSEAGLSSEEKKRKNITVLKPQWDMSPLYSLSFVVIARGGGSTLGELLTYAIPGLVVPFSRSADRHQEKNAQAFRDLGGGDFCREEEPFEILKKRFNKVLAMGMAKKPQAGNHASCMYHENDVANQKIFNAIMATYTKGDAPSER